MLDIATFFSHNDRVTSRDLQARGIPFIIHKGEPVEQMLHLARELQAAAILSDESELRTPRA